MCSRDRKQALKWNEHGLLCLSLTKKKLINLFHFWIILLCIYYRNWFFFLKNRFIHEISFRSQCGNGMEENKNFNVPLRIRVWLARIWWKFLFVWFFFVAKTVSDVKANEFRKEGKKYWRSVKFIGQIHGSVSFTITLQILYNLTNHQKRDATFFFFVKFIIL